MTESQSRERRRISGPGTTGLAKNPGMTKHNPDKELVKKYFADKGGWTCEPDILRSVTGRDEINGESVPQGVNLNIDSVR